MKINKAYLKSFKEREFVVECASKEEKFALLSFLVGLGEQAYLPTDKGVEVMDMSYPFINYHSRAFDGRMDSISGAGVVPYAEFITDIFLPQDLTVRISLNAEYNAEYIPRDRYITVGCQKIEVAKLQELVAAINKANDNL